SPGVWSSCCNSSAVCASTISGMVTLSSMTMSVTLMTIFPPHRRMGRAWIVALWTASLPTGVSAIVSPFFADENGMHAGAKDGLLERCTDRLPNRELYGHQQPCCTLKDRCQLAQSRKADAVRLARSWEDVCRHRRLFTLAVHLRTSTGRPQHSRRTDVANHACRDPPCPYRSSHNAPPRPP